MAFLSIIPDAPSLGTALFTTFITFLLILYVQNVQRCPHKLPKNGVQVALFICLLVLLFPMAGGDYYDYKEWVEHAKANDIDSLSLYEEHYEKVYWAIVGLVHNNYLMFRLVVWGGALFLTYKAGRILKLDKDVFILYLAILVTINLTTSRVILAMAIAFLGMALIVNPTPKRGKALLLRVIGALLVISSIYFHRSAIFLLAIIPLSLLKINKRNLTVAFILFPIVVIIVNTNMIDFIMNTDSDSLIDAGTAMYYMGNDKRKMGIAMIILFALYYIPMALYILLILKNIHNRNSEKWPVYVQKFMNASLLVIVFSSIFLFTTSAETFKLFERFTAYLFIPMAFTMTYLFKNGYNVKMIRTINVIVICQDIFNTLYLSLYLPLV